MPVPNPARVQIDEPEPGPKPGPESRPEPDHPPQPEPLALASSTLAPEEVAARLDRFRMAAVTRDLIGDLLAYTPSLSEVLPADLISRLTSQQRGFLAALLVCFGNITKASQASGIDKSRHYVWLSGRSGVQNDNGSEPYREAFPVVYESAIDHLESTVIQRATVGTRQYKFDKMGKPLLWPPGTPLEGEPYFEYQTSDVLLRDLMRAKRPDQFRPNVEIEIDLGSMANRLSDEQLIRIASGESPKKVIQSAPIDVKGDAAG